MSAYKEMKIWENKYEEEITSVRVGCRGILLKDEKILLSYESKKDWYFLPGGGLEEGETLEEGCVREVAEETGISILPVTHFMTVDEYYHARIFRNHFFLCSYLGQTEKNLTEEEEKNGLIPVWMPLKEAMEIFSTYPVYEESHDALCGSYQRDYRVLSELVNSPFISVSCGSPLP